MQFLRLMPGKGEVIQRYSDIPEGAERVVFFPRAAGG
jgi:hypothetical protein